MVEVHVERAIAAPVERVFDWLADPPGDGTHVDWLSHYSHPPWAGGKVTEAVTHRLLRSGFRAILDGCAKALES